MLCPIFSLILSSSPGLLYDQRYSQIESTIQIEPDNFFKYLST